MDEEFEPQEVLDLVAEALAEGGPSALLPKLDLPLALNEGRLLEVLSIKLRTYLPQADVQMLLDDLRTELYSDISRDNLKTIHSMAKNCRRCPNLEINPQLPYWNLADPDIVFVMESPSISQEAMDLLIKHVAATGFSSKRLTLTFVNRCKARTRKHTLEEIKNCTSYLHTELQLLQPKLIIPLGLIATATILGADVNLKNERGRICWLGPWAIMPTYSPVHVLRADHLLDDMTRDLKQAYEFTYGEK